MASLVSLEQVEELAAQLPPQEQLKLVARIGERLSAVLLDRKGTKSAGDEATLRAQREKEADELLAMCDAAAEMWEGKFDSVEDIRRIRAERDEQICPSR